MPLVYKFTLKYFGFWLLTLALLSLLTSTANASATAPQLSVKPLHQSLYLELDPTKQDYSGRTTITIDVIKPTKEIVFQAKSLQLNSLTLSNSKGVNFSTKLIQMSEDDQKLVLNRTLEPDHYELTITFAGQYYDSGVGLFKVQKNEHSYLFTQFQPMSARTAFPAFDHPKFKLPVSLTISTPKIYTALANGRSISEEIRGQWRVIRFKKTRPIYTDVIAFAVGQFDQFELKGMSVPGSIYTTLGNGDKLDEISREFSNILGNIVEYFGQDFPFEKLDIVVTPVLDAAAMENPGLISFKEEFLLNKSRKSQKPYADTLKLIAHEIAHMWLGNLVTMEDWNELWLNESLSEWLAYKIVTENYSEFAPWLSLPVDMLQDDTSDSKPIRRLLKTFEDVSGMGQLVYAKGTSIVDMLEQYLGEASFKQGLRQYIDKHKDQNANLTDFSSSLSIGSRTDVKGFLEAYLNRSGYPHLFVKRQDNLLKITIADNENLSNFGWSVPLTIKVIGSNDTHSKRILVTGEKTTVELPKNTQAYVFQNNGIGYFSYQLPASDVQAVNQYINKLNISEQKAWLNNLELLSAKGVLNYAQLLELRVNLTKSIALTSPLSSKLAKDLDFSFSEVVPVTLLEHYSSFLKKQLQYKFLALDTKGDLPHISAEQFAFASIRLNHAGLKAKSLEHLPQILLNNSNLSESMQYAMLRTSAHYGDLPLFNRYAQAYQITSDDKLKSNLLNAMGYFRDQAIVEKYFDFLLSDNVPVRGFDYRFQFPAFDQQLRSFVAQYITKHAGRILEKSPQGGAQWFVYNFYTGCTHALKDKLPEIFSRWLNIDGFKSKLTFIQTKIQQCADARQKNSYILSKMFMDKSY